MMTLQTARQLLRAGGNLADLGEAIGVVVSSPQSSVVDLLLSLKHGGFVAEQASLALYKRLGRKIPSDRGRLQTDLPRWLEWMESDRSDTVDDVSASTPDGQIAKVKRAELHELLTYSLDRTERLVLVLYYYEEMNFAEIGLVLDMEPSRVQIVYQRILAFLRRVFLRDAKPAQRLFSDLANQPKGHAP